MIAQTSLEQMIDDINVPKRACNEQKIALTLHSNEEIAKQRSSVSAYYAVRMWVSTSM